jgi:hypothetical protein
MMRTRAEGPDFLSIGMQKTGTGWLYEQLGHHPDVWLPPVKELHYLTGTVRRQRLEEVLERVLETGLERLNAGRARKGLWPIGERDVDFYKAMVASRKKKVDLRRYCALFSAKGDQITGDITPAYSTLGPEVIDPLVKRLPDLKVILGVRDPVERFWSQVSQTITFREKRGRPIFDFEDWAEVKTFLAEGQAQARSFATKVASNWRRHVAAERMLIIVFDDLKRDPDAIRRRVLDFLELDAGRFPASVQAAADSKASLKRVAMSAEIRAHLADYFAEELRACAAMFGGAAEDWPKRYGKA